MRNFGIFFAALFFWAAGIVGQNAPKAIANPDPVYPPEAAELGYGGTVTVTMRVNKKGSAKVLQAWGPDAPCSNLKDKRIEKVRDAVLEAAKMVEFEPPMKDGKPVEAELAITYTFDSSGKPVKSRDTADSTDKIFDAGVLLGRAKYLAKPDYPAGARASRASGSVPVSILFDVDGKVIAASARGGHPALQSSAVDAACRSTFEPVQLSGLPVKVSGVVVFNFII